MRSRTISQSRAKRAIGPSLSSDHDSAIAPCRDTRPNVGRSPETPQKEDGQRIDPQVSEPMANGTSADATAAPAPDDEPHVQRSRFQGLWAAPVSDASPFEYPSPPASSIIASLPSRTAPASRSLRTTVASRWKTWLSY